MKKLTYFILSALIILAPLTASALEGMSVESLKAATGQAGVTIGIDNVILYQNTGDITYYDNDGTGGGTDEAGITFTGAASLLYIEALVVGDEGMSGIDYAAELTAAAGLSATDNVTAGWTGASALTIDVGSCALLSTIYGNNTGGVSIGLPTLEIYDALATNNSVVSLVSDTVTYDNASMEFIEIRTSGNTMALLSPTAVLEIAPH